METFFKENLKLMNLMVKVFTNINLEINITIHFKMDKNGKSEILLFKRNYYMGEFYKD